MDTLHTSVYVPTQAYTHVKHLKTTPNELRGNRLYTKTLNPVDRR